MDLDAFKAKPWQTQHDAYKSSAFTMSPSPAYANSEVLLAGLYRKAGFDGVSEARVTPNGRELENRLAKGKVPDRAILSADAWRKVVHGVLESPKMPSQSAKRFLQLTPVVPEAARYSGAARLQGNPWPVGDLVQRMIWLGSNDQDDAERAWSDLFSALAVGQDDDVWARWLQQEFEAWMPNGATAFSKAAAEQDEALGFPPEERHLLAYPARRFAKDLAAVIRAKPAMTRRQWTSMLESLIRLACSSHVLWICELHDSLWGLVLDILEGKNEVPPLEKVRRQVFPADIDFFSFGQAALRGVRSRAESYLHARLGLNLVLWSLERIGVATPVLSSPKSIVTLCELVHAHREQLSAAGIFDELSELQAKEAPTLSCTKNIGSNIYEFIRHALGQRQALSNVLKGYDQGYVLRKKGDYNSAPWVVSLGPVLVITIVHCCLHEGGGPRSVQRLCEHLAAYGISVDTGGISGSELGASLRMLGLVIDSPDAETGMLLLPPFPGLSRTNTN